MAEKNNGVIKKIAKGIWYLIKHPHIPVLSILIGNVSWGAYDHYFKTNQIPSFRSFPKNAETISKISIDQPLTPQLESTPALGDKVCTIGGYNLRSFPELDRNNIQSIPTEGVSYISNGRLKIGDREWESIIKRDDAGGVTIGYMDVAGIKTCE